MSVTISNTETVTLTKQEVLSALDGYLQTQNINPPSNYTLNILLDTTDFGNASSTTAAMTLTWTST